VCQNDVWSDLTLEEVASHQHVIHNNTRTYQPEDLIVGTPECRYITPTDCLRLVQILMYTVLFELQCKMMIYIFITYHLEVAGEKKEGKQL
jgi:hypothetical protein